LQLANPGGDLDNYRDSRRPGLQRTNPGGEIGRRTSLRGWRPYGCGSWVHFLIANNLIVSYLCFKNPPVQSIFSALLENLILQIFDFQTLQNH
jgi:hypothetical protein